MKKMIVFQLNVDGIRIIFSQISIVPCCENGKGSHKLIFIFKQEIV